MEREQEWSEYRIADRIALLYHYLPQVHWEVATFCDLWNGHTIRAQRNRPHVVAGIPRENYDGDDTARRVDCAVAVDEVALAKLEEALAHDRSNVLDYLPAEIITLCDAMMATFNQDALPQPKPDNKWPKITEYRHLRACLQRHEDMQVEPLLCLATKPTGGWPALDALVRETGRSLEDILGEEIPDDLDPNFEESDAGIDELDMGIDD